MRWGLVALVIGALAGAAGADPLLEGPDIPDTRSYSERIKDNLSTMSLEINGHLGKLSGEMVDMRLDVGQRRGKLRLGGRDDKFGLQLDSDIHFEHDHARIKTRLDVVVAGKQMKLELPEFDMVPREYGGERYVELRLPLISGTF